jgi:hypothetical protein
VPALNLLSAKAQVVKSAYQLAIPGWPSARPGDDVAATCRPERGAAPRRRYVRGHSLILAHGMG